MPARDDPASEFVPSRRNWGSFWSLVGMQVQNAFNDNVAKFVLLPFGAWLVANGAGFRGIEHVLAGLLVLPFILFAPSCGWLADRFAKSTVIRLSSWFQLVVLGLMALALWQRQLWLAMFAFFLLAVQSSLLSPAKMGIVKELLGSKRLAFASGVMEATVILAILAGQILGGIWFDHGLQRTAAGGAADGWAAARIVMMGLWAGGLISIVLAHLIERTRPQGGEPFSRRLAVRHFQDARMVWSDRELRPTVVGVAYFWGFAGFVNLVVLQVAKEIHGGGQGTGTAVSVMMTWASVGIAGGSVVAGLKSRRGIDWGLVPIGAFATAVGLFLLALVPNGSMAQYAMLALAGAGAAVFLVPLNAHLQDHPPAARRGTVLAVSNLFNNLAGIGAVALQFGAAAAGVSVGWQFVAVALVTMVVGWFATWRHGPDMVRSIGIPLVRAVYRLRALGEDRVPASGGVLLLPNHVSFADAFIVSAATPRRVRFVMAEEFMRVPSVRWFARLFDTVPISGRQAHGGLRATIAALGEGDAICLFPEGQISRTGLTNELRRGFELIARRAGAPVVPVFLDGVWGSVFSFEAGRFFSFWPPRLPPPVVASFAPPLDDRSAEPPAVRQAWLLGAAESLAERIRFAAWEQRSLPGAAAGPDDRRRIWANGHQIGATAMLPRREPVEAWADDPAVADLRGLMEAYPALFRTRIRRLGPAELPAEGARVIGGALARRRLATGGRAVRFFDFEPAGDPLPSGVECYPCLALHGVVVAVSMPDPPLPAGSNLHQDGSRAGSRGRLLAGFVPHPSSDGIRLEGPSCPDGGIQLPSGTTIDAAGFVHLPPQGGVGRGEGAG